MATEIETAPETQNFCFEHLETLRHGPLAGIDFTVQENKNYAWDPKERILLVPENLEEERLETALAFLMHEAGHVFNVTEISLEAIEETAKKYGVPKMTAFAFDYLVEEMVADRYVREQSPHFLYPEIRRFRTKDSQDALKNITRKKARAWRKNTPAHIQFSQAVQFRYQALGLPETNQHPGASRRINKLVERYFPELAMIAEIPDEQERAKAIFDSEAFITYLELYYQSFHSMDQTDIQQAESEFIRKTNPAMADQAITAEISSEEGGDEQEPPLKPKKSKGRRRFGKKRGRKKRGQETMEIEEDPDYPLSKFEKDWEQAGQDALALYEALHHSLSGPAAGQEKSLRRTRRQRPVEEGEELHAEHLAPIAWGSPRYQSPPQRKRGASPESKPYHQLPIIFLLVDQSGSMNEYAAQRGYLTTVLERLASLIEIEGSLPLPIGVVGVDVEPVAIIDVADLLEGKNKISKEKAYEHAKRARSKRGGTDISQGVLMVNETYKLIPHDTQKRGSLLVVLTDLNTNKTSLTQSLKEFLALNKKNRVAGIGPFSGDDLPETIGDWAPAKTSEEQLEQIRKIIKRTAV